MNLTMCDFGLEKTADRSCLITTFAFVAKQTDGPKASTTNAAAASRSTSTISSALRGRSGTQGQTCFCFA